MRQLLISLIINDGIAYYRQLFSFLPSSRLVRGAKHRRCVTRPYNEVNHYGGNLFLPRSSESAGWRGQNQTMNLFSVEGGNGWEEGTRKSLRIKSTPIVESLWCVSCKSMKRKKSLSTTRLRAKKKRPAFEAEKSCCDCGDGGGDSSERGYGSEVNFSISKIPLHTSDQVLYEREKKLILSL